MHVDGLTIVSKELRNKSIDLDVKTIRVCIIQDEKIYFILDNAFEVGNSPSGKERSQRSTTSLSLLAIN
jgi:hypothetical protein